MTKVNSNLIIIYAVLLQLITGAFIMFSPEPINVARLGIFYALFSPYWLGGLYMFLAAILALIGVFIKSKFRIVFFLPQYFFLLLTTGSVLNYIVQQHYADGVIRSWPFIFIDQLSTILATILYGFSIFDYKKNYG